MSVENHPGFTLYCLMYLAILKKKPSPVRLYTKKHNITKYFFYIFCRTSHFATKLPVMC